MLTDFYVNTVDETVKSVDSDQTALGGNLIFVFIVCLTFQVPEMKIAEFANSVDLDEVVHNEPPHLDLHCLPSSL